STATRASAWRRSSRWERAQWAERRPRPRARAPASRATNAVRARPGRCHDAAVRSTARDGRSSPPNGNVQASEHLRHEKRRRLSALPAIVVTACAAAIVGGRAGAVSPPVPRFFWANGTTLAMHGKTYVWCGHWDDGNKVRTLRVQQGSPFTPPWWMIEVRLS